MRIFGLFSLIPVTMMLMVSFFVLFAIGKVKADGLKKFGRVIAVLLWICSAVVLSFGIGVLCGCPHCMGMMRHSGMWQEGKSGGYDIGKGGACDTVKGQMPAKSAGKEMKKGIPKK